MVSTYRPKEPDPNTEEGLCLLNSVQVGLGPTHSTMKLLAGVLSLNIQLLVREKGSLISI